MLIVVLKIQKMSGKLLKTIQILWAIDLMAKVSTSMSAMIVIVGGANDPKQAASFGVWGKVS